MNHWTALILCLVCLLNVKAWWKVFENQSSTDRDHDFNYEFFGYSGTACWSLILAIILGLYFVMTQPYIRIKSTDSGFSVNFFEE